MDKAMTFEHGGRTYVCTVETLRKSPGEPRWWFSVSGDEQRYAPIEAAAGDTPASVRSRIIAFYENRLWVRAQPPVGRLRFGQPGRPRNPPPAAQPTVEQ